MIELSIQYPQDCMKDKRPQLKLLDMEFLIQNLYWVILDTGVTVYLASQEIWHPHSIYPRILCTPLGYSVPPYEQGILVPPYQIS